MDPLKIPSVQKKLDVVESSIMEIERYIKKYYDVSQHHTEEMPGETVEQNLISFQKDCTIVRAGEKINSIFGLSEAASGSRFCDFLISEHKESFLQDFPEFNNGGELICTGVHNKGFEIPLRLRFISRKTDSAGKEEYTFSIEDRSCREELEAELEESRESYHILAETASDAIILIGFDFTIQFANSAVQRIFGYKSKELENRSVSFLFPESRSKNYEEQIKKYFFIDETHRKLSGMKSTIELLGKTKDGELVPLEISFGNSKGIEDNRMLTCIIRDIALRKKAERRLRFLAYHDKLTSLGNRDRLSETIDQLLAEIRRDPERKAALMFLDLDGFKKVNDSLGHEMGDLILKESARRLSNCIRQEDNVYRIQMEDIFRLGGDEFTILLPRINRPEDAAIVAGRTIDKILEPFTIEGYGAISDISMGVSVGIVLIPDDGSDKTTILRNADAAMYKAKEMGNSYVFFTKEMNNKAMERLMLEEGLRKSIGRQDFELYYQPIVDIDGIAKGVEALVRWNHPEKGLIPPGSFIEVAEDTRLILPIGRWVLETAVQHVKYWHSQGIDDFYVSINASPVQLEKEDLAGMVSNILKRVDLDPHYVVIELTETSLMEDPESAIHKMNELVNQNEGLRIAIDDFGTGYSSLGYLSQFPVHNLKIDRTFVMNLPDASSNIKIINSILGLGESLDLNIIAEGVETEEQLQFLYERGCRSFQGYLFSKALPFTEITSFLKKKGK